MKKIINRYFGTWWRPNTLLGIAIGLLVASELFRYITLVGISLILFLFCVLGFFCSLIYHIVKKEWSKSISTFLTLGLAIIIVLFYSLYATFGGSGDMFADHLKIPKGIPLEHPVGQAFEDISQDLRMKGPDSALALSKGKMDFRLYNSFQPGLYEYDFWISKIESGKIYLKAFEITHEYMLSEDDLSQRSSQKICNATDSIRKFGTTSHFTIYEGDWGKPYAARFEVWFKPDNGEKERILFKKNYVIEGWQR